MKKRARQEVPRPEAASAAKRFPCDIVIVPRIQAFSLPEGEIDDLLAAAGCANLSDPKRKTFSRYMSHAISAYRGEKIELDLRRLSQIRRRLEHLRRHSYALLTGFTKWEDIKGRQFGSGSGLSDGLYNLDEITRHLLDECGAERNRIQNCLLQLNDACLNAQHRLPALPHVLPRWAEQGFLYYTAIIYRDALDSTPTKGGAFARFARRAAKIAGFKGNVGQDAIRGAVDTLNLRNVIKTNRKIGMRGSRPVYRTILVSFIRPLAVDKTADGRDVFVTDSDWSKNTR